MSYKFKKGATSQSIELYIIDSTNGTPETGVLWNTAGIDLKYRRKDAAVVSITEAALTSPALTDTWETGGFLEIGNGVYRLDLPDAALASASGIDRVVVFGTVTGMVVLPVTIHLTDIDLNDAVRGGMTSLPNAAADAAGGLPISDAGGLDLDTKLANTNEITAARMGALTDWINGGRLDLILDIIAADTTTDIPTLIAALENISAANVKTQADAALTDINLDHLMKTAVSNRDTMPEVVDDTVLANIMTKTDGDTSDFDHATDSLEAIRDRGDAAWAGAPEACSGTIAVDTADTIFDLTATLGTLSTQDDTYNNMIICIYDDSGSVYETARITDYDGTNTRITIDHELTFPVDDGVDTWVIYRNAYAPVGAASITDGDMNTLVDKVYEELDADHMTPGTKGLKIHHSGGGRYR